MYMLNEYENQSWFSAYNDKIRIILLKFKIIVKR